jgi:hypothetical protein
VIDSGGLLWKVVVVCVGGMKKKNLSGAWARAQACCALNPPLPEKKDEWKYGMVEKMQIYLIVNTESQFLEAVGGCILFSISLYLRERLLENEK